MSKRNHDEFASDYDLQSNFKQECERILCSQADEEASDPSNLHLPIKAYKEASNPSNFDLPLGQLRKRVCSELTSKTGLEDEDQEYDLSHQKDEEHDISPQNSEDKTGLEEQNHEYDLSHQHHEEYNQSDEYYDDSGYNDSYQYYDEQEEEEDGMPDFECEEDMHRWMLNNAEDSHRTALFKDVGNQYPVWMKCEDKDLDGGLMKAMMMASNLCDVHDDEVIVEDL
ncbi:hypothetical protein FPQ18DRAFT_409804 [Pyronema domesticum]|nr:hypothetical protein FPQ18DRAFT_409804 [Pyronema domesticum]